MGATHIRCARFAPPLLISIALLAGCATPTSTRTTVVLLPEEDNTVGAVAVVGWFWPNLIVQSAC